MPEAFETRLGNSCFFNMYIFGGGGGAKEQIARMSRAADYFAPQPSEIAINGYETPRKTCVVR